MNEQDQAPPNTTQLQLSPEQMEGAPPPGSRVKLSADAEVGDDGVIVLTNMAFEPAEEAQEDPNALRGEIEKNLAAQQGAPAA